jgi:hypothetical protein
MSATDLEGLVRRLLTHEAAGNREHGSRIDAADRTLDGLCVHLSKRIGQEGFQTLLARAVTLTNARFPRLGPVRVEPDGSLSGLHEAEGSWDGGDGGSREETAAGAAALIECLLGLLITFIGEDLTLRMLGAVWPGLAERPEDASAEQSSDDVTGPENGNP